MPRTASLNKLVVWLRAVLREGKLPFFATALGLAFGAVVGGWFLSPAVFLLLEGLALLLYGWFVIRVWREAGATKGAGLRALLLALGGALLLLLPAFMGACLLWNHFASEVMHDQIIASPPDTNHHTSIWKRLDDARMDLKPGRLAFEPKKDMDQGQAERIFLRISPEAAADLSKGIKGDPPMIKSIQIGPVMRAELGYSSEDFSARRLGDETKVVDRPYTEWSWEVTPLHGGDKTLEVAVYADLILTNEKPEPYEAFVGSATIHVHTKPAYVVWKFLGENWQWVLGSPILLGLCAWLWARLQKPKPNHAGF